MIGQKIANVGFFTKNLIKKKVADQFYEFEEKYITHLNW